MSEQEMDELYRFFSDDDDFSVEEFTAMVNRTPDLKRMLGEMNALAGTTPRLGSEKVWGHIKQTVVARERRKRMIRWSRFAAVVALLLCAGSIYFFGLEDKTELAEAISNVSKLHGNGQVRLFLGDRAVVDVARLAADSLIRENGVNIHVDKEGQLMYTQEQTENSNVEYNTLQVPRGNEFRVVLSDNTEVWLNSDSELSYPTVFSGSERKVYLKGEACFKVTRDTSRPFHVVAEEMRVEVLGTHFNVNTYRDNHILTTTLVSGSVRVRDTVSGRSVVLCPNQEARLSGQGLEIRDVDARETVAWTNGLFLYTKMPLEEIARQLERWFDVEIRFKDPALRSYEFTGGMKRYYTLEYICGLIEEITNVRFEIDGKHVMVCRAK